MKILNLYAGIGGNRKLWGDSHEITAIEYKPEIARIYQDFFPNDKVIVADAHQYLLDHFSEFDFIWSSPPCPTHSKIRLYTSVAKGQAKPEFPDMKLYEEIIFLKYYFEGKYCVENVIGFYEPLIPPNNFANHYFWTNFVLSPINSGSRNHHAVLEQISSRKGFDLSRYKGLDKTKALRNCVEPETGLHILNCAINSPSLFDEAVKNNSTPLFT